MRKRREEEEPEEGTHRSKDNHQDQEGEAEDVTRYRSEIQTWKEKCKKLEKENEQRVNFLKQQFQT